MTKKHFHVELDSASMLYVEQRFRVELEMKLPQLWIAVSITAMTCLELVNISLNHSRKNC